MSEAFIVVGDIALKSTKRIGYGLSALLFINGLSLMLCFVTPVVLCLFYALVFTGAVPLLYATPSIIITVLTFVYILEALSVNRSGKRFAKLLRTPEIIIEEVNAVIAQAKDVPAGVMTELNEMKQSFEGDNLSKKQLKAQCKILKEKKSVFTDLMNSATEKSEVFTGFFAVIESLTSGAKTHFVVLLGSVLSVAWLMAASAYLAL